MWVRDGTLDPEAARANAVHQAAGVDGVAGGAEAESGISEANAVLEMSDEDSGGRTTLPGRGQVLTRASSSTECPFIIEVSSEEDGVESDLELIPASGGATATVTGSILGPSSVLDRANSGSFSLNTMD